MTNHPFFRIKKTAITVLLSVCCVFLGYSQEDHKYTLGVHFTFGKANLSREDNFVGTSYDGYAKNYRGKDYIGIAVDYAYRIGHKTDFCTGIVVTLNRYDYTYNYDWNASSSDCSDALSVFSVPLHLKYHLLKLPVGEFVIGGGIDANYHPNNGYSWGIGLNVNAGWEYTLKSGLFFALSPMMQWNLLDPLYQKDYARKSDLLAQTGLNIGGGFKW